MAFDPERCSPGAEASQQPGIIQVRGMATLKAKRRKLANSAQGGGGVGLPRGEAGAEDQDCGSHFQNLNCFSHFHCPGSF